MGEHERVADFLQQCYASRDVIDGFEGTVSLFLDLTRKEGVERWGVDRPWARPLYRY